MINEARVLPTLAPLPPSPTADGQLLHGRWAGTLRSDPLAYGPRGGRARRWMYAAAGVGEVAVGAAVVDLGVVAVGFAWLRVGSTLHRHDVRRPLGWRALVGAVPEQGATLRTADALLHLAGDGSLTLDVPTAGGRVQAALTAGPVTPVVLVTGTPDGGWNATQKAAGYAMTGSVALDGDERALDGVVWRDWTAGRQDRHTTWRWAAGGGRTAEGLVGFNVSTGMNAAAAGEDVVWWDGVPAALAVEQLGPAGDEASGDWRLVGDGWCLGFTTAVVRSADERLGPLVSRYVQPVGRLDGTLPGPDGAPARVEGLVGVTEDHEARW